MFIFAFATHKLTNTCVSIHIIALDQISNPMWQIKMLCNNAALFNLFFTNEKNHFSFINCPFLLLSSKLWIIFKFISFLPCNYIEQTKSSTFYPSCRHVPCIDFFLPHNVVASYQSCNVLTSLQLHLYHPISLILVGHVLVPQVLRNIASGSFSCIKGSYMSGFS